MGPHQRLIIDQIDELTEEQWKYLLERVEKSKMTSYVIKLHTLYYDGTCGSTGGFRAEIEQSTRYIHAEIAKEVITTNNLPKECKVYQINFVEQEVK